MSPRLSRHHAPLARTSDNIGRISIGNGQRRRGSGAAGLGTGAGVTAAAAARRAAGRALRPRAAGAAPDLDAACRPPAEGPRAARQQAPAHLRSHRLVSQAPFLASTSPPSHHRLLSSANGIVLLMVHLFHIVRNLCTVYSDLRKLLEL